MPIGECEVDSVATARPESEIRQRMLDILVAVWAYLRQPLWPANGCNLYLSSCAISVQEFILHRQRINSPDGRSIRAVI